jgi:diguanylate cyclase (GGDEF)-like protein
MDAAGIPSHRDPRHAGTPMTPRSDEGFIADGPLVPEQQTARALDDSQVDDIANQRDVDAHERDDCADRRDESGDERDTSAQRRDTLGDHRDHVLDLLDAEADRDDNAASERDRAASTRAEHLGDGKIDPQLPQLAAADRANSRHDRERAQQDRYASAADRDASRLDRSTSSSDRTAAHDDRSQSGLDRSTAQTSRSNAAVDRGIANFDDLTGTYRRGPGLAELEREMARSTRTGEPLTLVFVDVDGLKAVNDSLGHEAGDAVLVNVANALARHLRPYDVIVRFGGDEFLCLCQGLNETDAGTRLALVNAELAHGGRSISVGVAALQAHDTPASLTTRADRALYRHRSEHREAAATDAQIRRSGEA